MLGHHRVDGLTWERALPHGPRRRCQAPRAALAMSAKGRASASQKESESTTDIGFADGAMTAPTGTPMANELKIGSDVKVCARINLRDVLTGIN